MLAILERIRQAVAERLAKAKALIETYKPVTPAEDHIPDVVPEDPSNGKARNDRGV
jgi:hypothetical protein